MFINWPGLLSWIRVASTEKIFILRKLVVQTVVYHLWKQKNNLIHNQTLLTVATVFYGIDKELGNIISARRLRKHFDSLWLCGLDNVVFLVYNIKGPSCFFFLFC
ncbi:hypothetical protein F2Q68_00003836 [Brassica cretica]|uniref:Uncharacterized protein n=1 Tax=Brassica cretica TaxID=69181 RepID=A0A8S9JM05_BRACR|nr:hypothetical protein F2Q68_00003836 [Brassica cretica]